MAKLVWFVAAAALALAVPSSSASASTASGTAAASEGGANRTLMDTIVRYDWKLCDQCSDNANDLCYAQGIIRGRKNRRRCDWAPCDPNNDKVNNRGWFCAANSDAVLMPQGSKQDARDVGRGNGFALQTSHPANEPAGALLIPPQQALYCVPCNSSDNGWCDPHSGNKCDQDATCRSCDALFQGNGDVGGRGWTCNDRSDTPQVCVNGNGMVHINVTAFTVTDSTTGVVSYQIPRSAYASTIIQKRCKDTPFCLWGSIAGAVVIVMLTFGAAALAVGPATVAAEAIVVAVDEGAVIAAESALVPALDSTAADYFIFEDVEWIPTRV